MEESQFLKTLANLSKKAVHFLKIKLLL